MILFKVQGFFAKLRKNLAPEQFKSLHRHARVKVLLNCSAGIKIKGVCPSSIVEINYDVIQKIDNCDLIETVNTSENKLEIYDRTMTKIASMENAKLYSEDNYIKI